MLSVKSGLTEEEVGEIQNNANSLIERLNNGESFEKLAASYSSGQNALEGGFLGWRTSAELPSLFAQVVSELKVGEVAQPAELLLPLSIQKQLERIDLVILLRFSSLKNHLQVHFVQMSKMLLVFQSFHHYLVFLSKNLHYSVFLRLLPRSVHFLLKAIYAEHYIVPQVEFCLLQN